MASSRSSSSSSNHKNSHAFFDLEAQHAMRMRSPHGAGDVTPPQPQPHVPGAPVKKKWAPAPPRSKPMGLRLEYARASSSIIPPPTASLSLLSHAPSQLSAKETAEQAAMMAAAETLLCVRPPLPYTPPKAIAPLAPLASSDEATTSSAATGETASAFDPDEADMDDEAFVAALEDDGDEDDEDYEPTARRKTKRAKRGSGSRNGTRVHASAGTLKTMEDFWRAKGLTSKAQLDKMVALANFRKLYSEPERIAAKLAQLRTMLPGADVVKIVCNAPNILVYDVALSIPPKMAALQRLLPGCDVIKIVVSSPHLLTFNIDDNIAPKVHQLQRLLPGANIVKIISSAPNLLSYDVEGSLATKVRTLFALLPGADVVKLISYAPTLLYHDTEASIAPKLRALERLLPGCDVVKMVCAAPPLLCSDIAGSVARKLMWMQDMVDGTKEEVHEKIESNPRLLTCGYGVVFGRLEFLAKDKGAHIPVKDLRSILLAPVPRFEKDHPGYAVYLATQLMNSEWPMTRGKSVHDILSRGVKHLEREYGNCLRQLVNKN